MSDKRVSNTTWLYRQPSNGVFIKSCLAAGIVPGIREVARWRSGRGKALKAAWQLWPKGKNLPRLAFDAELFIPAVTRRR